MRKVLVVAAALVVACHSKEDSGPTTAAADDAGVDSGGTDVEKTLVLLSTTDLHARILPFDYYSAVADPTIGLAKVGTLARKIKADNPCTLLIDSGDTIQGTPLGTLYAKTDGPPHPMAAAMNALGYDAMALGNHEFNFGLPVLRKFIKDAAFPVLAANVRNASDGSEAFGSFVVKDVCGVKVGILGVVATVPRLVEPTVNIAGLRFDPILATVKDYAPKVRAAGAQVVVVAMHGGPDRLPADWAAPLPASTAPADTDAAMLLVAERVPEVDVVLGGHSHVRVPKVVIGNAIALEAGRFGDVLGKVTLTIKNGAITSKDASLIEPGMVEPDPTVSDTAKAAHDATVSWVDEKVGTTTGAFYGGAEGAYYVDSPLADLINAVQIDVATNAGQKVDLSASAVLSDTGLPTGDIRRRDVFTIYPFENTLSVVELTGADLIDVIGYNGRLVGSALDPVTLPPSPSSIWADKLYNWDFFTTVDYAYDFTTPYVSMMPRSPRLAHVKLGGADIVETATFRIAVNSFRANGNGNIGFAKGKVVWESPRPMREYLIDYVTAHPALDPEAVNVCNYSSKPDLFAGYFGATRKTKCSP